MQGLLLVMKEARAKPFTTKSDFARAFANEIGLLASEGLLTTALVSGTFTNKWMVTEIGIEWIEEVSNAFD